MNPFERPVTAGPNDRVVGQTEWGTPIYQTLTGQRYYDQPNWTPEPVAPFEALTTTVDDQGRGIHNRAPREESNTMRIVNALVGEAMRGVNAPKNALLGEPVSLGDTWATALDWGLLSAPMEAPAGALRAGSVRSGDWVDEIKARYPNVKIDIGGNADRGYTLSRIVVPENMRDQGIGSRIMREITDAADKQGATIALTPTGDFGGSVGRLRRFYEKAGFQNNTGRNRDFGISESMYRAPRAVPDTPAQRIR